MRSSTDVHRFGRRRMLARTGALLIPLLLSGRNVLPRILRGREEEARRIAGLLERLRGGDAGPADMPGLVARAGLLLEGSPYRGGTLEAEGEERLLYTLEAFDCVTLVETALVLARCAVRGETSVEAFERDLTLIRYRGGKVDGYASRLHYFLDWIRDNNVKGIVRDVTATLGGTRARKRISFMSDNRSRYPRLQSAADSGAVRRAEEWLSQEDFFEIPVQGIAGAAASILPGDIIGITTTRRGLDISHAGLAVAGARGPRLLHAGTTGGTVERSAGSLGSFVAAHPAASGIVVARPLSPAG